MTNTGIIKYNPLAELVLTATDQAYDEQARELCRQAAALFEAGDLTGAVNTVGKALQLNNQIKWAFYAMSVCLARLGRFDDALRFLEVELQTANPHRRAAKLRNDIIQLQQRGTTKLQITLFTMPKPFTGHIATIQRNALKSWLKLIPQPEIIILGDEEGVAEVAQEYGLRHIPTIATNEYGTPLVSAIFETAQREASNELMAYVNTDIILFSGFTSTVSRVAEATDTFLMIGRRWDLCIWEELDFIVPSWEETLLDRAYQQGFLHENTGIDYFAFRKGLYDEILPFAVGRTAWDNWLIWYAKQRGASLIDATRDLPIIHQDHDYTHNKGGILNVWNGAEAQQNRKLAANNLLTIAAADMALENGKIIPPTAATVLPEPTYKDYARAKIIQAREALGKGLIKECADVLDYVEHLIEQKPRNLYLLRAQCALEAGNMRMAEDALREELNIYPDNVEASKTLRFVTVLLNKEQHLSPLGTPLGPVDRPLCIFLNTYYNGFLANQYRKHPELATQSYSIQKDTLIGEFFGDSDFYSLGLISAGWRADELIMNCDQLQMAWAKEQGFAGTGQAVALEQINRVRPDVLYIQDMHSVGDESLRAIRPAVKLLVGQIASPASSESPFHLYDVIISSFPHFVERFRKNGITSYYQPLAFEPRLLEKIHRSSYQSRAVACSFIGGISPMHQNGYALLEYLAEKTPIQFWGYGAETLPGNSPIRARHNGETWGKEMFSLMASSRITINRHIDVAENSANNMRLFEATGCGALLITDYKDNLNDLFEIGTEVVAYRSPEECASLINYYLANPDEAEAIARAGQARTLRDHTYELRMAQTAEILERHLRYQGEQERLPSLDSSRISSGHTAITKTEITVTMASAWQDSAIPARQRALVQQELAEMYKGRVPTPFQVLADILKPYTTSCCSVLEIGCASGYYYEILGYLLNKRLDYTGVDYSEAMIAMARDYYPKAKFFVADGANLFFADRQFHTVISSCILLHVPNYRDHILETTRVADRFIVAARTPVCRRRPTQYLKKLAYGVETVELIFNEEEFVREFALNRFELVHATEYHADSAADAYQITYLFKRI